MLQKNECSFGYVARSAVLLKPNFANILLFNCEQKLDCNGHSLLIFAEKWPNYASGLKSAPNSDSLWVYRLFNVCVRVFCAPNATILIVHQDQNELHLKRWFFWKIGIFCKSIAGPLSEAKTHWRHNHIRSAEG